MTRPFNQQLHCPNCRTLITHETSFGRWIRNHRALDSSKGFCVVDQDYLVHRFKANGSREFQCIMQVEIKTFGANLSDAQRDTLHIWNQITRNRKETPTKTLKHQSGNSIVECYSIMLQRRIKVKCFGVHVLTFSDLGPDESEWIEWDRKRIGEETLVGLLKFDIDPDSLKPIDLRNHHLTHENSVLALDLPDPDERESPEEDA